MALIDVTNLCNLKCSYCNRSLSVENKQVKQEPSLEKIMDIFEQIEECEIKHVALQGGEPMLRADLCEIIKMIGEKKNVEHMELKEEWFGLINEQIGYKRFMLNSYQILKKIKFPIMSVTSNGTIYKESIRDALYENNFHLEISLDSPNEELHDQNRYGNQNYFQMITSNIRKYAQRLPVIIKTTVHKNNIEYMQDMIQLAQSLNCIHIVFHPLFSTGRAKGTQIDWTEQYVREIEKIIELGKENELPVITEIILPVKFLTSTEQMNKLQEDLEKTSNLILNMHHCEAYEKIGELHIMPSLDVYGCPQLIHLDEFLLGNLYDSNIKGLWNSEKRKMFREQILQRSKIPKCSKCELVSACYGGCVGVSTTNQLESDEFDYSCRCYLHGNET